MPYTFLFFNLFLQYFRVCVNNIIHDKGLSNMRIHAAVQTLLHILIEGIRRHGNDDDTFCVLTGKGRG